MIKTLIIPVLFFSFTGYAQIDTTKWLRAFPITGYMLDLNDSTKVVQVLLNEGLKFEDKQLGMMRGVYKTSPADTVQKGYGRCHLIKGNYYYFTIGHNTSGLSLQEGDLLYTVVTKTAIYYGQIPRLASHSIELQDVYGHSLYDFNLVFDQWTEATEKAVIDTMVKDIWFTGNYFTRNEPSMDKLISKGKYKDRKLLSVMMECQPVVVNDFIDFMIACPGLYAGRKWKIAEVFATWLTEGAPTIIKETGAGRTRIPVKKT